jgi:hypothetical protein
MAFLFYFEGRFINEFADNCGHHGWFLNQIASYKKPKTGLCIAMA